VGGLVGVKEPFHGGGGDYATTGTVLCSGTENSTAGGHLLVPVERM